MRSFSPLRGAAVAVALAAASVLGACAGGARSDQMVVATTSITPVTTGQPGYRALRLAQVQGGSETNPLWMSNVSGPQFRTALENSLRAAGHLAENDAEAQYEVGAELGALNRPLAGFDLSVTSNVRYRVTPVAGGAPVLDENVAATGTATMSDAFIGTERLRIANEASIRENIESFITRLRTALAGQNR